ncbi:MAG: bifunctional phosphopantothenoylcysteine decarboxylase/phosphopantothenate synthase, partial [Edaphobacter sp.]
MSVGRIKVTVGVCGGIAAYKAVELVRLLQHAGLDPHVVMTRAAEEFVRPLTFEAISGHQVITSLWGANAGAGAHPAELGTQAFGEDETSISAIEHINEAQSTKVLVVAPATADVLGKFAHGLADDFLTTMFLATPAPMIVAPAMNVNMWGHAAVRANMALLRERGVRVIEPGSGYLACGMVGGGRLAEPEAIAAAVGEILAMGLGEGLDSLETRVQEPRPFDKLRVGSGEPGSVAGADFAGETVLVTAGGTREAIDPVRFIGNRSSGRMGYAVAEAARRRGARVILITAPTGLEVPAGCEVVRVVSAAEMRSAMMARLTAASMVVMAAAVSDYRVKEMATQKIKREGTKVLELEATEDILSEVVARRRTGTLVVGFAAETENVLANGREKLERKGVDALVVNDVS